MGGIGGAITKMEHGTDFAGRASGDVEESQEFGRGTAFKALGDVVGDGEGGAAELVAQVSGLGEESVAGQGVDTKGEIHGGRPTGKVFESFVFHVIGSLCI